jgi:hypothetical protein
MVLRGITDDFRVRGRHSCMSPVQLPPGLPADVMEEMITRFRAYVLAEISIMIGTTTQLKANLV